MYLQSHDVLLAIWEVPDPTVFSTGTMNFLVKSAVFLASAVDFSQSLPAPFVHT